MFVRFEVQVVGPRTDDPAEKKKYILQYPHQRAAASSLSQAY
jgi:hypothetical protein